MWSGRTSKMPYGVSMGAPDFLKATLYHPMNRLWAGWARNCVMGMLFGVIFIAGYAYHEILSFRSLGALVIVGLSVSVFLWGSFRLWSFTIAPMLGERRSLGHLLTRIPYWFIAGGIGYTLGLLVMKKTGFLDVRDIPVKDLFIFGGKFSAGMELVFECVNLYIVQHGNAHDKN